MTTTVTIDVGRQFSRFPVGRYIGDGESNGQKFREEVLLPALTRADKLRIELDAALGYGSSFLEEAFGGAIRAGISKSELLWKVELITGDESLKLEILQYIEDAARGP